MSGSKYGGALLSCWKLATVFAKEDEGVVAGSQSLRFLLNSTDLFCVLLCLRVEGRGRARRRIWDGVYVMRLKLLS